MSGFNLPPGVSVNDIPGNRPEDEGVEVSRKTVEVCRTVLDAIDYYIFNGLPLRGKYTSLEDIEAALDELKEIN